MRSHVLVYTLVALAVLIFFGARKKEQCVAIHADTHIAEPNKSSFMSDVVPTSSLAPIPEEYACTNIYSKGSPAPAPFPPTTFDLSCRLRGTCDEKLYLFVLCPPFSGSTAIYSLLSTSKNAVTFLNTGVWAGEGQHFYYSDSFHKDGVGKEVGWDRRWDERDGFFNATSFSEALQEAWNDNVNPANPDTTVFIEKSPPHLVRPHKLFNEFRGQGRVRFLLMLQNPCISRHRGSSKDWSSYAKYLELAHLLLSQYNEITLFVRYEELLLNLDHEVARLRAAFPELEDIDPSAPPEGNFGARSEPLTQYIHGIDTIQEGAQSGDSYLRPKREALVGFDSNVLAMARALDLL